MLTPSPTLTPFRCADCRTTLVRLSIGRRERLLACLQCGATGHYEEAVDRGSFHRVQVLTRQQRVQLRRLLRLADG